MTDAPGHLVALTAGERIVYGGDRYATVTPELAAAFSAGDQLVVDPSSGALLHVPAAELAVARRAVDAAVDAFAALGRCSDDRITEFFDRFADRLADDSTFAPIAAANQADVESAAARGRSTTRLVLSERMRDDMVSGLRGWAVAPADRDALVRTVEHRGWTLDARRAPLGVVAFVFEGRPNVFADAVGVVRTGNAVVFRIGSDALATAHATVEHALGPALAAAGLPAGTVSLVESAAHAAGWALFSDPRVALAVARGSGPAVAQLGAVARSVGVPVSLHGTGGAWMVAAHDADPQRFALAVRNSLDRKVCNTLNVCCIDRSAAAELVPAFLDAVAASGAGRAADARVHATAAALAYVPAVVRAEPFVTPIDVGDLDHEWEWEESPEVSLHVVDDLDDAIGLCNALSPRFVASLISESTATHRRFWAAIDAPFVGDGMTRWVDGQYALDTPELGLSNWEEGRMLARGGILSGESIYTIRYRAAITDAELHR